MRDRFDLKPSGVPEILGGGGGGDGLGGSIGGAISDNVGGGGGGGLGVIEDAVVGGITTGVNVAINKDLARDQRRFLRQFSKTTYQRTMKDLELAGLNPLLVGKLGTSGAAASAIPSPQTGFGISRAAGRQADIAATTAKDQRKLLKAQTRLSDEQRLRTELENYRLGSDVPVWEERFKANDSALGRIALRGARERELNQAELQQIKDLYNPFSSGVAKPIDLQFRRNK